MTKRPEVEKILRKSCRRIKSGPFSDTAPVLSAAPPASGKI